MIPDNQGIAKILAAKLKAIGIATQLAVDPPLEAKAILFLEGCNRFPKDHNQTEHYLNINERLFLLASRHAIPLSTKGSLFVSVQDSGGTFGLRTSLGQRCWLTGLAALTKTAALEWPDATVKAIDIECDNRPPEAIAEALFQELVGGGFETQIGLTADGQRWCVFARQEQTGNPVQFPLVAGDVVVVSGGARGVTAHCLQALCKHLPLKIAILGRTPLEDEPAETKNCLTEAEIKQALFAKAKAQGLKMLPKELLASAQRVKAGREARQAISALEALGSQVMYFAIDIRQPNAVQEALLSVRKAWGGIHGLIHASGVLADKYLKDKTLEQFHSVFDTKILGLKNLLSATQKDSLKLLSCFSSIAAFVGNIGQCDYAMANELCNQICEEEQRIRGTKCVVKSFLWGPWAGGMADASLQNHFAQMGIQAIPLKTGAEAFVDEFKCKSSGVSILLGDRVDRWEQALQALQTKEITPGYKQCTFWVNQSSYPFLNSHRVQNQPVIPILLVASWCLRTAEALFPGSHAIACHHLRLYKGIILSHFTRNGDLFNLTMRIVEGEAHHNKTLFFELIGTDGTKHYSCQVELMPPGSQLPLPPTTEAKSLAPGLREIHEMYKEGALFHGPDFQVIKHMQLLSENESSAILHQEQTKQPPWVSSLTLLDGGLQVEVAMIWETKHQYTLPTYIGKLTLYGPLQINENINCNVNLTAVAPLETKSNLYFSNEQGQTLASMLDVKVVSTLTSTLNT